MPSLLLDDWNASSGGDARLNFGMQLHSITTSIEASRLRILLSNATWNMLGSACEQRTAHLVKSISYHELFKLVVRGMGVARRAPTPAFNLHDHFMLAGAVATAFQNVPDAVATNVEVGSFAGHTAIFQAEVLNALGLHEEVVHSVDASLPIYGTDFGLSQNVQATGLASKIIIHRNTSKQMRPWNIPLRFFFEDSKHNYATIAESFDTFESSLLDGGVLVLHDVGCCHREFPSLMSFVKNRVLHQSQYAELHFPTPASWDAIPAEDAHFFRSALNDSVDQRPGYRQRTMKRYDNPLNCSQMCGYRRNYQYMEAGYQWSLCQNVRVFQRRMGAMNQKSRNDSLALVGYDLKLLADKKVLCDAYAEQRGHLHSRGRSAA